MTDLQTTTHTNICITEPVNPIGQTDSFVYGGYTGAFASFFQTGNLNAHKLTDNNVPGIPVVQSQEEFAIASASFMNLPTRNLGK